MGLVTIKYISPVRKSVQGFRVLLQRQKQPRRPAWLVSLDFQGYPPAVPLRFFENGMGHGRSLAGLTGRRDRRLGARVECDPPRQSTLSRAARRLDRCNYHVPGPQAAGVSSAPCLLNGEKCSCRFAGFPQPTITGSYGQDTRRSRIVPRPQPPPALDAF